jgi:hypothetical protein
MARTKGARINQSEVESKAPRLTGTWEPAPRKAPRKSPAPRKAPGKTPALRARKAPRKSPASAPLRRGSRAAPTKVVRFAASAASHEEEEEDPDALIASAEEEPEASLQSFEDSDGSISDSAAAPRGARAPDATKAVRGRKKALSAQTKNKLGARYLVPVLLFPFHLPPGMSAAERDGLMVAAYGVPAGVTTVVP